MENQAVFKSRFSKVVLKRAYSMTDFIFGIHNNTAANQMSEGTVK